MYENYRKVSVGGGSCPISYIFPNNKWFCCNSTKYEKNKIFDFCLSTLFSTRFISRLHMLKNKHEPRFSWLKCINKIKPWLTIVDIIFSLMPVKLLQLMIIWSTKGEFYLSWKRKHLLSQFAQAGGGSIPCIRQFWQILPDFCL